jgi:hypothetical protein
MKRILYFLFVYLLLSISITNANAQIFSSSQNISGIINTYTTVTALASCSVTVASTTGFAVGNKVLIIQMKGAAVDLSNNALFGDLTAINNAGNYEFATINLITGTNIQFARDLLRSYDPTGSVQLITVPQYNGGAVVSGLLTAQAWNGTTGGVLAFEATTLTLNANIDVSGRGFRPGIDYGGASSSGDASYRGPSTGAYLGTNTVYIDCSRAISSTNPAAWSAVCGGAWRNAGNSGCGCTVTIPECINPFQVDPLNYPTGTNFTCSGYNAPSGLPNAEKGEGIFPIQSWYSRGRGKLANGGGGGNMHNGGGGGGSNFGTGGLGGRGLHSTSNPDFGQGIGGVSLSTFYAANKIFLGGGGGAGQGNDNRAIQGSEGGGIVMIKATSIQNTTSSRIMANGRDNTYASPNPGGYDGSGGGGGGGVVWLDVTTYNNTTALEARGGKGADNLFAVLGGDCYAPGGGGGGGVIGFSQAAVPPGVTTNVTGGPAGVQTTASGCVGTYTISYGATAGVAGGIRNSILFPEGTITCALPVQIIFFEASVFGENALLEWKTSMELNNDRFEVLRSVDLLLWETVGTLQGKGNTNEIQHYVFLDTDVPLGTVYYRLKQIDYDNTDHYTHVVALSNENFEDGQLEVFPNPVQQSGVLQLLYLSEHDEMKTVRIIDVIGRAVLELRMDFSKGINQKTIDLNMFSRGTYLLEITSGEKVELKKIQVY